MNKTNRAFNTGFFLLLALNLLVGCNRGSSSVLQGYVEGEFVYISSPLAGLLQTLEVSRGSQVKPGQTFFQLDDTTEQAAVLEAEQNLNKARALLEDAQKGKRPAEIASLIAQLKQAKSAYALSIKELTRQEQLIKTSGAISQQALDQARALHDQNQQRVTQLEADLRVAQMGSRSDQVAAAEAEVEVNQAALTRAEWELAQKHPVSTQDALVFDTFFGAGEWVPAGHPVLALLSPANIKVRTFVPQTAIGRFHLGDAVEVKADGVESGFHGQISFISPQAEYTPPVIYSQDSREKLVFMIEIVFDASTASQLHPGQPVDVTLDPEL